MVENRPIIALLWMLGAAASFTIMAVAGREVQTELNTFELMMYRSALGWLIICAAIARRPEGFAVIRTTRPGLHVIRNLFHFAAQNLWFFSVTVIPLAQVVSLEMTNPIWVALIAPFLLGERLTAVRAFAALVGFAGVLVIVQPGAAPFEIGHTAALAAAIGFALNTIFTKQIMRLDSVLCVLFWMTLSQTLMGLVLAVPGGIPWPSTGLLPWLLLVGLTGVSAHFSLSTALRFAPATTVAPMEFIRLPVIAVAGMLIYGEELKVSLLVGASLILAGNVINMRSQRRPAVH